jgi:DinB family protein
MAEHPDEQYRPSSLSRRGALKVGAASMSGVAWALTLGHGGADLVTELAHLAQGKPMTAARLVDILRAERVQWNALLAEVGMDRMEIPGVEGAWSVKELVAHLTWYEHAVVDGARQVASTGAFTRPGDEDGAAGMDERNERIAAVSRPRPVSDVLAEADAVFGQLLNVIATCPDDLLNDSRLIGLPGDIPPWMRVANNSYAHYREHAQSIRVWLARQCVAKR